MVDIPGIIARKQEEKNIKIFLNYQMLIASNNRFMKDDAHKEFIRNLTKNLEGNKTEQADKLDRDALEALRLMTNQGANRTGGR